MGETGGTPAGPGTAETPSPEGGPVENLERKGQSAGGDGTGGSVNVDDRSSGSLGPTAETSKPDA